MGMFDNLICNHPLPTEPPEFARKPNFSWQTKSLECAMNNYEITGDGRLRLVGGHFRPDGTDQYLTDFHGEVEFYNSNLAGAGHGAVFTRAGEDAESVDYVARFVAGQLVEIKETARTREPALPIAEMHKGRTRPTAAEMAEQDRREAERLTGRVLWLAWGGKPAAEGYEVKVIAENDRHLVVEGPDKFEIIDRRMRDSILFDSLADAERQEHERQTEAQWIRDEYAKLVKERS